MKPAQTVRTFLPVLLLAIPFQVAPAAPVQSDEEPPPAEPDLAHALATKHEGPVCGLGKAFHAERRAELRARLGDGLIVLRGLPETRDYVQFRQDKAFWYLTGVESPDCALVMDAESGHEILFLPQRTPRLLGLEGWEGEKWDDGDEWVPELTGFEDVRATAALHQVLAELLADDKKVWVSTAAHIGLAGCFDRAEPYNRLRERDIFDKRVSREKALAAALEERYEAEVHDLTPVLNEMRRVKVGPELEAVRRASYIAALAVNEAMRSTRPGVGEWELDALMTFEFLRRGAAGNAYDAIVGSEANAIVLHYIESTRRLGPGEMLLVDNAPEVDHYVSDITRSWPTDGVWTERMAEIYDAVLAAQEAGIAAVKPGATLAEVNQACMDVIRERDMQRYVLHGFCHWVGLEVHDVGENRRPLVPGCVFTIEPGLYDKDAAIGVRIEDVVLVTEDGCEVLTAASPKGRAEISALIAEEGTLDGLDGR